MKLTFNRADFLQAARKLCKVAPETSPVACLTGILLEADAENLEVTMTASNQETEISCDLSAAVMAGGSVVINALLFTEMLRLFGEPTVTMETQANDQLLISCGNANFTIVTLSAKGYPKIKIPQPQHISEISNLRTLVKSTVFAVSKNGSNQALKCVKLELVGSAARTVGTDGTRLMVCNKPLGEKNKPLTLLIPPGALVLLASLVEDTEKLRLESTARYAVFHGQNMTFSTLVHPGTYIDENGVLSGVQGCYEAMIEAGELADALDMLEAAAAASEQLRMVFTASGISLSCAGENAISSTQALAQVIVPTPPDGFYYPLRSFAQGVSTMSGMLKLTVAQGGFLLASNTEQTFFQAPIRPKEKTLKAPGKPQEEKKPTKKTKTKKTADKAA